jgi:hypothetical protein
MILIALFSRLLLVVAYVLSVWGYGYFWAEGADSRWLPTASLFLFLAFYIAAQRVAFGIKWKDGYWSNFLFALAGGFYLTAIVWFLGLSFSLISKPVLAFYALPLIINVVALNKVRFPVKMESENQAVTSGS